jgi:hypothetical protein
MEEKPIQYEPHPVSPARKAHLIAQGFRIIDAKFKPREDAPPPQKARPVASDGVEVGALDPETMDYDDLKAALTARGVHFRGNASKAALIGLLQEAAE